MAGEKPRNLMSSTQAVTDGNTFSLDAIELRFRDATAV